VARKFAGALVPAGALADEVDSTDGAGALLYSAGWETGTQTHGYPLTACRWSLVFTPGGSGHDVVAPHLTASDSLATTRLNKGQRPQT